MPTSQIIALTHCPLTLPAATAAGYERGERNIEYSPALVRDIEGNVIVNITRDQARELLAPAGFRPSTAAEEHELSKRGYIDAVFDDTWARNTEKKYFWNWTDTGLLKTGDVKTKSGRTYWLRTVTEGGNPVGELWVPEGNGKVVKEWSAFGLPTETAGEHCNESETHFYFNPDLDNIAVLRCRHWSGARSSCFYLGAGCGPSYSSSDGGVRQVRGVVAVYKNIGSGETSTKSDDYARGVADGRKRERLEMLGKFDKFVGEFRKGLE